MVVMQVRINFSGSVRAGSESVLHFGPEGNSQDAVDAADALVEIMDGAVVPGVTMQVDPVVRALDEETGELVSEVTVTAPAAQVGTAPLPQLADQSAMLIRWTTGSVVNGRVLRGRTFWPGISASYSVGGAPSPPNVDPIVPLINTWLNGPGEGLVIWSRTAGVYRPVDAAAIAPFWASQRRRRN